MREVQVLRWCDACGQEEEPRRTPSVVTLTIGIAEGETRPPLKAVDLCAEHDAALIAPLRALLEEVGQTPALDPAAASAAARRPPSKDPGACRLCDRPFAAMGALVGHIYSAHAPGRERPDLPLTCGVCGRASASAYGARMHRTQTHHISALDDAYTAAAEAAAEPRRRRAASG